MRDHPNNAAALWQLSPKKRRVAEDGSLIIEKKRRERLDEDDCCIAATQKEREAFIRALYGRPAAQPDAPENRRKEGK